MANIKVKDLTDTSSITTDNQLMVLTNDVSNIVQNISVENFINNIVSSDSDNGVTVGTDDKLYVDNSDSGVTAGTYQYPQNLVVDSKGKITSVINGTPAAVPIATSSSVGTVKPDNTTITVTSDGTISAQSSSRNIGEIVTSTTPLTDAGLHLLDGALIQGSGIYSDFVDYMANLYNDDPTADYFSQGSVMYNYVKIGNPTNNNGILSGFSDSDYVQMPQAFPVVTSCKVVFKVKLSDFTRHQVLFSRASGANQSLMLVRQNTAKFCCYDGSWIDGTTTLSANVDYWFGVSYNGTAFTGYLLQDNNYTKDTLPDFSQWSQEWTTTTTNFIDNNLFNIGYNALSSGEYWSGSVDLNNCYIEVNGSLWWEGSSILTPEQSWQQSVTNYGVCGKFVYDSVNNTVRLPKYNSKIYTGDGTAPVIGNGMALGLTDGTLKGAMISISDYANNDMFTQGYYGVSVGTSTNAGTRFENNSKAIGVTTDASKSGIIVDLSGITTSLDGYYYIVIATSTKTEIEVDIDEIATDLNGKADVDLTNVNNSGTSKVAGWAMPSNTNEDVTLGANGATYTAPANGWFTLVGYNGSAGSTTLLNETSSVITITGSPTSAYYAELSVPCAKNDVIELSWHNGNLTIPAEGWFKFVYAKGSESEAQ